MHLGEQEDNAGLGQDLRCPGRFQVDLHPQRFQYVGGAAFGGGRAVAMLGDRHARARHHKDTAVDILSVPWPSPPVPHRSMALGGAETGRMPARIARTAPQFPARWDRVPPAPSERR